MISAVVLTHNDEKIIELCLKGLTWADEMIVIDDYSSDNTVEKAKKIGAIVFKRHLDDDFADQRNFGLSKAKGDWVFFVDSDEVVPKELADEIQDVERVQGSQAKSQQGYLIRRKDYLFGTWLSHGEQGRMKLLRLAKKNAGKWDRPVHEIWNIHGHTGELFTAIQHFPHQNVAQFLEEINRYSSLNARYLLSENVRVRWWHIPAYPVAKFFRNYFFYFGFLDGTAGIIVAIFMSFHSFLTRAKLWQLYDRAT